MLPGLPSSWNFTAASTGEVIRIHVEGEASEDIISLSLSLYMEKGVPLKSIPTVILPHPTTFDEAGLLQSSRVW